MSQCIRLIVGIDFGTTYSGASWALDGGERKVRLVTTWPDPMRQTYACPAKVPSIISYLDGKPHKWGYAVKNEDENCFRWFKLLLEPDKEAFFDSQQVQSTRMLLKSQNLSAGNVVRDYLKFIWAFVKNEIDKHYQGFRNIDQALSDLFDVRVILTVPALWSPTAKNKTRTAALEAGIPNNINLIDEPEAGAIYTLQNKNKDGLLKINDVFVVCDAGGGTVDLCSYTVVGINPLKLDRCAIPEGELCGSVFIDQEFLARVRSRVGRSQWDRIQSRAKADMMKDFERLKQSFNQDTSDYEIELRGITDAPERGIENETITLSMDEFRDLMDVSVTKIDRLVKRQKDTAESTGVCVRAILLIGGFGESDYLLQYLRMTYQSEGIDILQVNEAWAAVCRGATQWGLESTQRKQDLNSLPISDLMTGYNHSIIRSHIERYSYGVVSEKPFNPDIHSVEDMFHDEITGRPMARNQMIWLVRRGTKVATGQVFSHQFSKTFQNLKALKVAWDFLKDANVKKFSQEIFYCSDDYPPEQKTQVVKKLCKLQYEMDELDVYFLDRKVRNARNTASVRETTFDLFLILQSSWMEIEVQHHGRQVGKLTIEYADITE